jgi:hypothetical protein
MYYMLCHSVKGCRGMVGHSVSDERVLIRAVVRRSRIAEERYGGRGRL